MTFTMDDIVRRNCQSLEPIPTGVEPSLRELDVRAVMFDIYGTLLISASGDITSSRAASKGQAFVDAFEACGVGFVGNGDSGAQELLDQIAQEHIRARLAGIEFPEVDIIEMWRQTVAKLVEDGRIQSTSSGADSQADRSPRFSDDLLQRLAMHYELRVNPVWAMPHARQCLESLHDAGLTLGIISNAQSFTKILWRVLLDAETSNFAFNDELTFYSYSYGRAKPGSYLFELATEALQGRGIGAHEVLYVGNDMLNDIMPARDVGFQTALFAGDARSLRLREHDARVTGVTPDVTVTDLLQLIECVGP
jgi:putative hydrolase of the HAD superfamily